MVSIKYKTASLALVASLMIGANAVVDDSELCLGDCNDLGTECTFYFSINIFMGDNGYYAVEGCDGIQPTLGMKAGVKYTFDQTNITNWFHPLGFAYGPDGVYGDNVELEPVEADPVGNQVCTEAVPCQHPQYKLNGVNLCTDCGDPADFGLDEYEGVYFSGGRDAWVEAGNFSVEVTITDPDTTELFYFCHIHNQMSGRIKVLDGTGSQRNPADLVPIPYEYGIPDEFESECGVFNISQFQKGDACDSLSFLCGEDLEESLFARCMHAIDCAMHEEMRTHFWNKDPTTIFMHQMIPHHRNAVNMAKILLKQNPPSLRCGTDYDGRRRLQTDFDEDFCHEGNDDGGTPAETLLWEIINGQNQQITFMKAWLEDNLQPSHDYCAHTIPFPVSAIAAIGGLGGLLLLTMGGTAFALSKKKEPEVSAVTVKEDEKENVEKQI